MKWVGRLTGVAMLGLALACGLALLPDWRDTADMPRKAGDGAPVAAAVLNDANLVDRIGALAMHAPLSRVNLHHAMLAVELVAEPSRDREGASSIFDDLLTLCRFSFEETTNVKEILVRVVDRENRLLLSMEADRSVWHEVRAEGEAADSADWAAVFGRHFAMVYTDAWQAGFRSH